MFSQGIHVSHKILKYNIIKCAIQLIKLIEIVHRLTFNLGKVPVRISTLTVYSKHKL